MKTLISRNYLKLQFLQKVAVNDTLQFLWQELQYIQLDAFIRAAFVQLLIVIT